MGNRVRWARAWNALLWNLEVSEVTLQAVGSTDRFLEQGQGDEMYVLDR